MRASVSIISHHQINYIAYFFRKCLVAASNCRNFAGLVTNPPIDLSDCYNNATRQSKNNARNSNTPPWRGFFPTQACTFTVSVDANTYLSDTWPLRIQADSYKHIY